MVSELLVKITNIIKYFKGKQYLEKYIFGMRYITQIIKTFQISNMYKMVKNLSKDMRFLQLPTN